MPEQALSYARRVVEREQRADALAALAEHLPQELMGEALAAAREIGDTDNREQALAGLAPRLAQEERARLYPLWRETLRHLVGRTRTGLLSDLAALEPVIHRLGEPQAIAETFCAIQDVGR